MQQLDIPFFVHPIDGSDLPLIKTLKPIRNFIETSGLSASRKRLQELDSEAIEFQLKLIRGAIQARALRESRTASKSLNSNDRSPIGEDQIPTNLEASTMVASQLLKTAIHDDQGSIDWLGMNLDADGDKFTFGPVGISLYSGSIGIACLLARLQRNGVYFNNNASTIGSKEAIKAILNPLNEMVVNQSDNWRLRWWRDQGFGISGCGGVLLALQCLQTDIDTLDEKILCPKI
ncbi:MAG: type 2 lantipeptide synthetase LanM, partial [Prochlorococcus sp.]